MSVLEYKGYQGSVSYEDATLVVRVLHIDDLLVAEFDRAADAQKIFQGLIDEYLEDCEKLGREPNRPFRGSFNVRVEPEVHRRAAQAAARSRKSLNSWVSTAIEISLNRGEEISPSLLQLEEMAKMVFRLRRQEEAHYYMVEQEYYSDGIFSDSALPSTRRQSFPYARVIRAERARRNAN